MSVTIDLVIKTCKVEGKYNLSKLPPPPSSSYSKLVEVIVDKDKLKTFYIYKSNWAEADGTARLPEDDFEIFQLFQNFVHTGRLTGDTRSSFDAEYIIEEGCRSIRLLVQEPSQNSGSTRRDNAVPLTFGTLAKAALKTKTPEEECYKALVVL